MAIGRDARILTEFPASGRISLGFGPILHARPDDSSSVLRFLRQVGLAGGDRDSSVEYEVGGPDDPSADLDEGPLALVDGQPDRPDHRGRAEVAHRAEAAASVHTEPAAGPLRGAGGRAIR